MTHTITNQDGKFIHEPKIRTEIQDMIDKGLDYTYFDGKKISVMRDYRCDDIRETVIEVEYE